MKHCFWVEVAHAESCDTSACYRLLPLPDSPLPACHVPLLVPLTYSKILVNLLTLTTCCPQSAKLCAQVFCTVWCFCDWGFQHLTFVWQLQFTSTLCVCCPAWCRNNSWEKPLRAQGVWVQVRWHGCGFCQDTDLFALSDEESVHRRIPGAGEFVACSLLSDCYTAHVGKEDSVIARVFLSFCPHFVILIVSPAAPNSGSATLQKERAQQQPTGRRLPRKPSSGVYGLLEHQIGQSSSRRWGSLPALWGALAWQGRRDCPWHLLQRPRPREVVWLGGGGTPLLTQGVLFPSHAITCFKWQKWRDSTQMCLTS